MFLQCDDAPDFPTAGEILFQIGWVLLVHLAIAADIVQAVHTLGLA